jgi:hypothetical protein
LCTNVHIVDTFMYRTVAPFHFFGFENFYACTAHRWYLFCTKVFVLTYSMLTSSLTLNTYSLDKFSCTSFAFTLQMAEVLIGSLMIGNCSDRLCVRVSRMWEFYDPQDESNLLHADMVLIDEEVRNLLTTWTLI